MSRHRHPGPIPNRWLHCPRVADSLVADRFIAFKTPLSERFHTQMPDSCQFQPSLVFSFAKMLKVKIGIWFDLTNTNRFYDRSAVENEGVNYVKLNCRGHGETPSPEQTQSFIEFVEEYIQTNPLDKIAIHCTHGFNRTGFLICCYMVERMDCSVEAAICAFAQARPPGIYKADYIKELFRRYEEDEEPIPAPPLPEWCFEEQYEDGEKGSGESNSRKRALDSPTEEQQDGSDQEATEDGGESTNGTKKRKRRRKEKYNENATFMSGVRGVTIVTDKDRHLELQRMAQDMCGWDNAGFPGCQPVSMTLKNMNNLAVKKYMVSWKADGTRYMMLIVKEHEIYFLDRDNAVFQVSGLTFPHRHDFRRHLRDTLLDGEMVIDKYNGICTPRYLIYDIIKYEGEDVPKAEKYKSRLNCIDENIIKPRHEALKRGWINRNNEPFGVRKKDFFEISYAGSLLGPKFAERLCHEPDGLIFQPAELEYVAGTCDEVLKWKPLDMNSIDFQLKIETESGEGILTQKVGYLYVGQCDQPLGKLKYTKALKDLDKKIVECKYENNTWVFMRERTDKSYPNSYNTAKAVWESIKKPVTKIILLNFIQSVQSDSHRMPPPPDNLPNHC